MDIRTLGSGNAGGTNALRTQGAGFAFWVMLIDIGKGWLAAAWLPGLDLPVVGIDPGVDRIWLAVACAAAVVVGHVYPVWYGFRGGKGAATLVGVLLGLKPIALLPVLVVWLLVVMLTGYRRARHHARRRRRFRSTCGSPASSPSRALLTFGCVMAAVRVLHAPLEHRAHARGNRESRAAAVAAAPALSRIHDIDGRCREETHQVADAGAPRAAARPAGDGEFHSGEQLAKRLRISRGGIWKLMRSLRAMGIDVESVPRQGYRLPRAVDLLEQAPSSTRCRRRRAPCSIGSMCCSPSIRPIATSPTSAGDAAGHAQVCVAEMQNAGRGRRGRSWVAPFGSGICMSLGWQFAEAPPTFSALSLAVGVAAVRALRRLGIEGVGLKWPNDLIWQQRKLGGILIEMRGESAGPAQVVIGIGINMRMPAQRTRLMLAEQQAALIADVHEIMRERTPTRNVLIAALVEEVIAMLQTFGERGFEPFAEEWRPLDTLADAPVKVISGAQTTFGRARGVEVDGTLLVDVDGELRSSFPAKSVCAEVSSGRRTADGD